MHLQVHVGYQCSCVTNVKLRRNAGGFNRVIIKEMHFSLKSIFARAGQRISVCNFCSWVCYISIGNTKCVGYENHHVPIL